MTRLNSQERCALRLLAIYTHLSVTSFLLCFSSVKKYYRYPVSCHKLFKASHHLYSLPPSEQVFQLLFITGNKAVTDRRLRPRCCHLGSYFKRPKSSPVRPLACDTGITAHSLLPSPRLRVHCASSRRRHRATLAYEQTRRHP